MRKLRLHQEALAELTTDELGAVAGASGLPCDLTDTCKTTYTLVLPTRCACTGYYPSWNAPCESEYVCIATG